MSLSQAILDALIATGATREQLAAVMRADIAEREAEEAAKLETKRAKDRERQQRHRLSRKVTVTPRDERDVGFNERDNLTSREGIPQEAKASLPQARKSNRAARLPEDWQPKPLTGKAAEMVACWQAGELERELAKFKNYWLAKGGAAVSTNWQRNWVNWLINADERKAHGRTNSMGRHQPDGLSSTARAGLAVFGSAPARQQ